MQPSLKNLLDVIHFTSEKLSRTFNVVTIQRGMHYFEQRKVLQLSADKQAQSDDISLEGRVSGSSSNEYIAWVEIDFNGQPFAQEISSNCSCPVGVDCKHGFAVLLTYLAQQLGYHNLGEAPSETLVEKWLHNIEKLESVDGRQPDKTQDEFHLIYLLNYRAPRYPEDANAGLSVLPSKARTLNNGGYGALSKFSAHLILDKMYQSGVFHTQADNQNIAIFDSLSNGSKYTNAKRLILKDHIGHALLERVLQTGRCFWQNHRAEPLLLGALREFDVQWELKEKGYEASVKCEPAIDRWFCLDKYYYLDKTRHQIGPMTHETLTARQTRYFLESPPLPKQQAQEISQRIAKAMPEINLDLPGLPKLETVDVRNIKPVCHLNLHTIQVASFDNQTRPMHLASLSFEYQGHEVRPKDNTDLQKSIWFTTRGQKRYKIYRQIEDEQRAIDALISLNFHNVHPMQPNLGVMDFVLPSASLLESATHWDQFLTETILELTHEGWKITQQDDFSMEVTLIDGWYGEVEQSQNNGWFEMTLGFDYKGRRVNLLPMLVGLLAQSNDVDALKENLKCQSHQLFEMSDNQWVKIPTERIGQILNTLIELYDKKPLNDNGKLLFTEYAGGHYSALLNDPSLQWKGAQSLKDLALKIQNFTGIETVTLPQGLQAQLREYQHEGVNWLEFLRQFNMNGILADDMGLGKTVQALTQVLREKQAGRSLLPSMVIAPTSLMRNWLNEAKTFTPNLRVLILQGTERHQKFDQIKNHDLILTTYPLMVRDQEIYAQQAFHYLILDEAQAIKNTKSKSTQLIYKLKANHRLCLTGTPMENHLGELWSMFHFLMPGFLGPQDRFRRLFRTPIENHGDEERSEQLRQRLAPFMLRRRKDVVAKELPPKTEIIRSVPLSGDQRDLYETVRLAMDKKLRDQIKSKGIARSHIMVLDALLKLRQVCCDPRLVKLDKAREVKESAKFEMLMEMVPELVEEGRKILLFSQFTSMLSLIEEAFVQKDISFTKLTGQTKNRGEVIDQFQTGDAKVFLISLKAGGVGLNLTAADTVIHYDPWWNPAVERQATDRAHRIGQDKPVFVYKLLTEQTVEEKILALQEKKQALADNLYGKKSQQNQKLNQQDLLELLQPI